MWENGDEENKIEEEDEDEVEVEKDDDEEEEEAINKVTQTLHDISQRHEEKRNAAARKHIVNDDDEFEWWTLKLADGEDNGNDIYHLSQQESAKTKESLEAGFKRLWAKFVNDRKQDNTKERAVFLIESSSNFFEEIDFGDTQIDFVIWIANRSDFKARDIVVSAFDEDFGILVQRKHLEEPTNCDDEITWLQNKLTKEKSKTNNDTTKALHNLVQHQVMNVVFRMKYVLDELNSNIEYSDGTWYLCVKGPDEYESSNFYDYRGFFDDILKLNKVVILYKKNTMRSRFLHTELKNGNRVVHTDLIHDNDDSEYIKSAIKAYETRAAAIHVPARVSDVWELKRMDVDYEVNYIFHLLPPTTTTNKESLQDGFSRLWKQYVQHRKDQNDRVRPVFLIETNIRQSNIVLHQLHIDFLIWIADTPDNKNVTAYISAYDEDLGSLVTRRRTEEITECESEIAAIQKQIRDEKTKTKNDMTKALHNLVEREKKNVVYRKQIVNADEHVVDNVNYKWFVSVKGRLEFKWFDFASYHNFFDVVLKIDNVLVYYKENTLESDLLSVHVRLIKHNKEVLERSISTEDKLCAESIKSTIAKHEKQDNADSYSGSDRNSSVKQTRPKQKDVSVKSNSAPKKRVKTESVDATAVNSVVAIVPTMSSMQVDVITDRQDKTKDETIRKWVHDPRWAIQTGYNGYLLHIQGTCEFEFFDFSAFSELLLPLVNDKELPMSYWSNTAADNKLMCTLYSYNMNGNAALYNASIAANECTATLLEINKIVTSECAHCGWVAVLEETMDFKLARLYNSRIQRSLEKEQYFITFFFSSLSRVASANAAHAAIRDHPNLTGNCNIEFVSVYAPTRQQLDVFELPYEPLVRLTHNNEVVADIPLAFSAVTVAEQIHDIIQGHRYYLLPVTKKYTFDDDNWSVPAELILLADHVIPSGEIEFDRQKTTLLGEGVFGCVYSAKFYGSDVAVKYVNAKAVATAAAASNQEEKKISVILDDIRREAWFMLKFPHERLQRVYGFVNADDFGGMQTVGIVSKLYEKGALTKRLKCEAKAHAFDFQTRMRIAEQVADGLWFLHANGVVHLDLESENVLIDEDNNAVISDLGIARYLGKYGHITDPTRRFGPDEVLTTKTDIYGFGRIVYGLLFGCDWTTISKRESKLDWLKKANKEWSDFFTQCLMLDYNTRADIKTAKRLLSVARRVNPDMIPGAPSFV